MKIHRAETITRYHVTFDHAESKKLKALPQWQPKITWMKAGIAQVLVTRTELSRLCEDLGIDRIFASPAALGVLPIANTPEYDDLVENVRAIARKQS